MRYLGHNYIMLYVAADLSIGVLACHPIKFNNASIMPINLQSIVHQLCESKVTKTNELKDPGKQLSDKWTRFVQMFINIDGSWETAHQQFYSVNMKIK